MEMSRNDLYYPRSKKMNNPLWSITTIFKYIFLWSFKLTHVNIIVPMFQDFDESPIDESNTTLESGNLPFLTYKISLFSFFLSIPSKHSSVSQEIFSKKRLHISKIKIPNLVGKMPCLLQDKFHQIRCPPKFQKIKILSMLCVS